MRRLTLILLTLFSLLTPVAVLGDDGGNSSVEAIEQQCQAEGKALETKCKQEPDANEVDCALNSALYIEECICVHTANHDC